MILPCGEGNIRGLLQSLGDFLFFVLTSTCLRRSDGAIGVIYSELAIIIQLIPCL